jgi:hypothetical protein
MKTRTTSPNRKLKAIARVSVFSFTAIFCAMKAHADCEAKGEKSYELAGTVATQAIQTGADYLKNVQNFDVLKIIPRVDLDVDIKGYSQSCQQIPPTSCSPNGGPPPPCGTLYNASATITGDIKGYLPNPLGKTVDIPWSLGPWTLDATCQVGINCQIGGTLSGGGSYTQNCNDSVCTTESVTGGGYLDITGGVDLLLQWYRRSGAPTGSQQELQGEVEQNLTLTASMNWSQGSCSSPPNAYKICVGEIRPDIKFTLPHFGKFGNHQWTLKFPYALYDGTPGC